jgi:hypothetical protein
MRRPLLLASLLVLSLSPAAHAADPNNVKEADSRFQEGVRLMAAGKTDEARVRFAEANALVRSTDILWNLIAAERQSSHYADALNHARQFVRDPKAPANEVAETNVNTIPKIVDQVGQIEIEAPAGAQVEIDSREKAGHAPLLDPYAVTPGTHEVIAIAGADRLSKTIDVAAGQTVHVSLTSGFKPIAPAANLGATSATTGRSSMTARLSTSPPDDLSSDAPTAAERQAETRKWVTLGLGAGAVLLAAGSVVLFSMSQSSSDAASELRLEQPPGSCPNGSGCAALSSDLHNQNDYFHIGEGLAIGAGVVAVAAVVSWFALRPHERPRSASHFVLLPAANPSQPGFVVGGVF